jgi:hypothetical protein
LSPGRSAPQFAGDGDVAPAVAEPDRRGEIECALLAGGTPRRGLGHGPRRSEAEPALEEVVDQGVALGGIAAERIVADTFHSDELAAGQLGDQLAAAVGLDLVVVAVHDQHRATDAPVHRLADIERGRNGSRLDRLHQHRPVVSLAHSRPSSICLVECGSLKMCFTKCSAKSG